MNENNEDTHVDRVIIFEAIGVVVLTLFLILHVFGGKSKDIEKEKEKVEENTFAQNLEDFKAGREEQSEDKTEIKTKSGWIQQADLTYNYVDDIRPDDEDGWKYRCILDMVSLDDVDEFFYHESDLTLLDYFGLKSLDPLTCNIWKVTNGSTEMKTIARGVSSDGMLAVFFPDNTAYVAQTIDGEIHITKIAEEISKYNMDIIDYSAATVIYDRMSSSKQVFPDVYTIDEFKGLYSAFKHGDAHIEKVTVKEADNKEEDVVDINQWHDSSIKIAGLPTIVKKAELDDETSKELNEIVSLFDLTGVDDIHCSTFDASYLNYTILDLTLKASEKSVYLWNFEDFNYQCFSYNNDWYFLKQGGNYVYGIPMKTMYDFEIIIYKCEPDTVQRILDGLSFNMTFHKSNGPVLTSKELFSGGHPQKLE